MESFDFEWQILGRRVLESCLYHQGSPENELIACLCSEMKKQGSEASCQSIRNCKRMFSCRLIKITRTVTFAQALYSVLPYCHCPYNNLQRGVLLLSKIMDKETEVLIVLGTCTKLINQDSGRPDSKSDLSKIYNLSIGLYYFTEETVIKIFFCFSWQFIPRSNNFFFSRCAEQGAWALNSPSPNLWLVWTFSGFLFLLLNQHTARVGVYESDST